MFTEPRRYGLSTGEYGVMFAPQTDHGDPGALLGGRWRERWGDKRVFLAGLGANLASMALLVGEPVRAADDHAPRSRCLLVGDGAAWGSASG